MADPRLLRILEGLRSARFADLKGARASAVVPLGERLLNDVVAAMLPSSAPVRDLTVRPQAGDRLAVRGRASRLEFLPPMTVTLLIEGQPQLPDTPLVLRMMSVPGLFSMAGAMFAPASLPAGIRLDRDRILIDVRTLLERNGAADLVPLIERLRVTSEEGRLLLEVDLRV